MKSAVDVIGDMNYLKGQFIDDVAKRGAAIIGARGKSSAASAASAAIDSVKSLLPSAPANEIFSLAVNSDDNPYRVPDGLIFSFPCQLTEDGTYAIASGYGWDDFLEEKIQKTTDELLQEREVVKDLLG